MKRIELLLMIVISAALLTSCASPKDLVYQDVKNFRVNKISMHPEIGMDVQFYNPNKHGMTLKNADVNLYINEKLVGKAFLEQKYEVPGLDTFLLPVALNADLKGVISNGLELMANKEVNVRLEGFVKAGKGYYINIPVHYAGKKKLNVF